MKKIVALLMFCFMMFMPILAMGGPSDTFVMYPIAADPCQNPSAVKSQAIVTAGAAATVLAVALTANKSTYVCSVNGTLLGTTTLTSFKFTSGTQTTNPCDTGAADVTGLTSVTGAIGSVIHQGYGGTLYKAPSGKQLCLVTAGTSSGFTGTVTYVSQ